MSRFLSWIAIASSIICAAVACLYLQERSRLALSSANEIQAQRQVFELNQQLIAANAARRAAESVAINHKKVADPNGDRNNPPRVIRTNDIIRDHPEFALLYQKQQRRAVIREYGEALASLKLTSDQLALLKNLLVERTMSSADAQDAAREAGLQPGNPAFFTAIKQATQGINEQISGLIGPDGLKTLSNAQMLTTYEETVSSSYAPDFTDAGLPLTADQSQSLAQLLGPSAVVARQGAVVANKPDSASGLSPRDDEMLTAAAQFLSPDQIAILKAERVENNQRSAIMMQYMRPQAAAPVSP